MSSKTQAHPPLSARKRADIVEAAVELFRRDGFAATSMDRIAREAGVSKRTVYNHFAGKEELFQECVGVLLRRVDDEIKLGDDPDAPVAERLRAYAHRKLALTLRPEVMATFRALTAELMREPALGRRLFESGPLAAGTALADLLRQEHARGRLRLGDEAEIQLACQQFSEMIKGPLFWPCLMGLRDVPSEAEEARVVDDAVIMFLARYGVAPASPRDVPAGR